MLTCRVPLKYLKLIIQTLNVIQPDIATQFISFKTGVMCSNDPSLELRRNELGLRYLYKLKSNLAYIHTLNTLNDSEDQKYEESERSVKPTGVQLRILEQRYMEEQKQIEEMN